MNTDVDIRAYKESESIFRLTMRVPIALAMEIVKDEDNKCEELLTSSAKDALNQLLKKDTTNVD